MNVIKKLLGSRAFWTAAGTLFVAVATVGFNMTPQKAQMFADWVVQIGSILTTVLGGVAIADRLAGEK